MENASGIPVYCAFDELIDIISLMPNPRNPNQHPEKQIRLLAKIIKNQGWRAPITVSTRSGFIVRGHGRLMAARLLGVDQVPVDRQDYATEAEEWADLIADNRLNELSEVDEGIIKKLMKEIDESSFDLELTGYDSEVIDKMFEKQVSASIDDLLNEVDVAEAVEKPIWATVRTASTNQEILEKALSILEKNGIRVERSYE